MSNDSGDLSQIKHSEFGDDYIVSEENGELSQEAKKLFEEIKAETIENDNINIINKTQYVIMFLLEEYKIAKITKDENAKDILNLQGFFIDYFVSNKFDKANNMLFKLYIGDKVNEIKGGMGGANDILIKAKGISSYLFELYKEHLNNTKNEFLILSKIFQKGIPEIDNKTISKDKKHQNQTLFGKEVLTFIKNSKYLKKINNIKNGCENMVNYPKDSPRYQENLLLTNSIINFSIELCDKVEDM